MRENLTWLHISDIHFNSKTEWRDSASRSALLKHLEVTFASNSLSRPDYIFCTGDIAYGESSSSSISEQYSQAKLFFNELLAICGEGNNPLSKERLFVVPGNHDINRKNINAHAQNTLNIMAKDASSYIQSINQQVNDKSTEFNDAIKRLDEYAKFIDDYLPHQRDNNGRHHYVCISDINGLKVGIAGFNSAWSCSGSEDDRHIWLAATWQFNAAQQALKDAEIRIGLIHHPVDWLNSVDQDIATKRMSCEFDFWLHGHIHNAWVTPIQSHIIIAAGAIGADKSNEFGINLVSLDLQTLRGCVNLFKAASESNDWTIAPVASHAPEGKWGFDLPSRLLENKIPVSKKTKSIPIIAGDDTAGRILTKRLDDALKTYTDKAVIWIFPTICKKPENIKDAKNEEKENLLDLITHPKSTIIKAPAQYGLTCLAHYLTKEAWISQNSLWIYLDSRSLKPNITSITEAVTQELALLKCDAKDIKCIVLDSCVAQDKDSMKLLTKLSERFKELPIVCMQQIEIWKFSPSQDMSKVRQFDVLYLWALHRNQVRKIISAYNEIKYIGNEDAITNRLVSDLEMFNLHRSVFNCLTLLKTYEVDFIESPINRSQMINRVLFQLFNAHALPTYKTRPDLQDCEYIIGYFCELLVRKDSYVFSRDMFLLELQTICGVQLMDIETHVIFDVLYENNIIVKQGSLFCFKFSFWIYYFAAHRMHHDKAFADYILENMQYAKYPEVIEFYTGIDRKREDALQILIRDITECRKKVQANCGFPDELNPYKFCKWKSSTEAHKKIKDEIMHGVFESNLPDEVKDHFSDQNYDQTRPYNQAIHSVLNEHSFWCMLQTMKAGAKALRNSDFALASTKSQLLNELLNCWDQTSKVLFVVLPVLTNEKYAVFDGIGIALNGDFCTAPDKRFLEILCAIPDNVVDWSKDDLFSPKMGPLLIAQLSNCKISDISKHELILLLIIQRPRSWEKQVHRYITSVAKDSFYLRSVYEALQTQYSYSFATQQTLEDIKFLIMMSATKHVTGQKEPGVKAVSKVAFKSDPIPPREV